ncbi:MAG: hypothetical protein K9K88_02165 [Desulfobacterales bacterium]|nr:hypothetical protein [Desulfobacterales bacterium]
MKKTREAMREYVLDNFHWKTAEIEQLMIWIKEDDGLYPGEKALRYMRYHPKQVESWMK